MVRIIFGIAAVIAAAIVALVIWLFFKSLVFWGAFALGIPLLLAATVAVFVFFTYEIGIMSILGVIVIALIAVTVHNYVLPEPAPAPREEAAAPAAPAPAKPPNEAAKPAPVIVIAPLEKKIEVLTTTVKESIASNAANFKGLREGQKKADDRLDAHDKRLGAIDQQIGELKEHQSQIDERVTAMRKDVDGGNESTVKRLDAVDAGIGKLTEEQAILENKIGKPPKASAAPAPQAPPVAKRPHRPRRHVRPYRRYCCRAADALNRQELHRWRGPPAYSPSTLPPLFPDE